MTVTLIHRWFKWSQRDIRSFVGKNTFRGYETRLRTVVALLPEFVAKKQNGVKLRKPQSDDDAASVADKSKTVAVTKAFQLTLEALEKSQLWELDAEVCDIDGTAYEVPITLDGYPLDITMVNMMQVSRKRLRSYYTRYYLKSRHEITRTAADCSFATLSALAKDREEKKSQQRRRETSIEAAELEELFTCAQLRFELDIWRARDRFEWPTPKLSTKKQLSVALAEVRSTRF